MPKVSVRTAAQATTRPLPPNIVGGVKVQAYFDRDGHPVHLHQLDLGAGQEVAFEPHATDRLVYVWHGSIIAGAHTLTAGSSMIVEHRAKLAVRADKDTELLVFAAAAPPAAPKRGGQVHLLPAERAPRSDGLKGSVGVGGVMHADADCETCSVWLHENRFAGRTATRADAEAGIHSHSEDEVIFVLDGDIRLGERLYGPGTALAIAADTLYSFTPGPNGLHFANFRAAKPGDIRFASGHSVSETAYWRGQLPRPEYLAPPE